MYDTYARYIYEWLTNNRIADKLSTITSCIENISAYIPYLKYLSMAVVFFGLVFFAFKFIRFRGLQID